MIPLSKITGEKNSNRQTKYNQRIPLSQIVGTTSPQEEPEASGGLLDTAGNAFDWWKNNSLAGAGFLGGLASETAGNILQNLGLESAGNLAQNAADTMLDFGAKKVYTADADNYSGSFANQLMSGLTGSLGRLASMIHSDKTADTMINFSESLANKTPVSTDNLAEYFTNPRGFVSDAGQLAGSMAAIVPFMGLVPEASAARGVATFGGDAITQALINRGLYGAAKVFACGAPRAAQYALTSAPVEGAMEGGETRRELLNQGASEEEATKESFITGLKNVPLLLATNTLEGLAFFSPLKGANKEIGGRALANFVQQQYEEFVQEGIQNAARGEPYSWLPWNGAPEQYEAAERVRYPALLMGGIGGTAQALDGRNENQENFERGSQENISVEDFANRAQKSANQLSIDRFMRAIGQQESDGDYDLVNTDSGAAGKFQIMPENWSSWAQDAGLSPDAPMTPENQELVARNKMLEYYNKFGSWRDVAIAWYGGEGAVDWSEEKKNRPQGEYPSVNEYADSVCQNL